MSHFARKKITNEDTLCDNDEATPTGPNGHYIIANGICPTPLSPTDMCMSRDEPDSPELYRMQSYEEVLFDIRKVNPEKIAAQMTLLDLPLFKAIQMEEFRECRWTKKEKLRLAPNIVAFTNKFNHTSFWVVQEILKEPILRVRSEVVTQFIRIAKKLLEMNNLHSLTAVVSALQSTAIFRLTQTWKCVHKKDKCVLEKLRDFISDTDNWKQLRDHMDEARLPCVPHLGIYLTDLSYLHSLPFKAAKSSARQMATIVNMIAYCQNSCYDDLAPELHIQKYLQHKRYIDELLKFFEEEQYKLSLRLEPDLVQLRRDSTPITTARPTSLRASRSHEDLLTPFSSGTWDSLGGSPAESSPSVSASKVWTPQPPNRTRMLCRDTGSVQRGTVRLSQILNDEEPAGDIQITVYSSPETDGKRRSRTLPRGSGPPDEWSSRDPFQLAPSSSSSSSATSSRSNVRGSESSVTPATDFVTHPPPSAPPVFGRKPADSPSQWKRTHQKSFSVGTNVLAVLGIGRSGKHSTASSSTAASPEMPHQQTTLSLIDDSVLDTTFTTTGTSFSGTPTGSLGNLSSSSSSVSMEAVGLDEEAEEEPEDLMISLVDISTPVKEGFLKRKVLRRNNKTVSSLARRKVKYWVQLTESSLILYTSKPSTKKSGKVKVKQVPLSDCRVKFRDPTEKTSDKAFVITDALGNQSKFSAKTPSVAQVWVEKIRSVIKQEEERLKQEIEKSLIKL